ncbi:MAG: hypothetical protein ACK4UY_16900, partial [Dietzia sp.]
ARPLFWHLLPVAVVDRLHREFQHRRKGDLRGAMASLVRHSLPADAETADALLLAMRRLRARTPPSYARAARLVRAATQTAARRRLEGTLRFAHADLPLPPLPLPSPGSPEDGQGGAGGEAEAVQRARAQRGRFSLGVDAADVLKERSPAAAAAAAAPETGGALPWFVVDC